MECVYIYMAGQPAAGRKARSSQAADCHVLLLALLARLGLLGRPLRQRRRRRSMASHGVVAAGWLTYVHVLTQCPTTKTQKQTDEDGSPRYPPSATIPRNTSISHLSQEQQKVKLIRDAIRAEDKRLRTKVRVVVFVV